MASSEDDKVPPTPSHLKSVTEKNEAEPVEDQTSDKLSDEGLGTSETDKNEEEKLTEVSDASNEDLASRLMKTSNDITSQDSSSAKQEVAQTGDVSVAPVVYVSKEIVDSGDSQDPDTGGKDIEGQKETEEKKMEVETTQVIEEQKEPEQVKEEEKVEEESVESQDKSKEAPTQTETRSQEVTQPKEVCNKSKEEISIHEVTEDRLKDNVTAKNTNTESLDSDLSDTKINGDADIKTSVEESSTEGESENKIIDSQSEEKPKVKTSEEAEQPSQEDLAGRKSELQDLAPNESNIVSDEGQDVSKVSDQTVASKDDSVKEDGEKAAQDNEIMSQDAISVQDSEADSETKVEHGSPAVVKSDVEKDSDSGSSSAADSNSLDLNLSISSFLSKSKEGGSISLQVK